MKTFIVKLFNSAGIYVDQKQVVAKGKKTACDAAKFDCVGFGFYKIAEPVVPQPLLLEWN